MSQIPAFNSENARINCVSDKDYCQFQRPAEVAPYRGASEGLAHRVPRSHVRKLQVRDYSDITRWSMRCRRPATRPRTGHRSRATLVEKSGMIFHEVKPNMEGRKQ